MHEGQTNLSDAAVGIIKRMENEPANRRMMYEILVFCRENREMKEISTHLASSIKDTPLHPCETFVSWLSDLRALKRTEKGFCTTEEGMEVVRTASPENRLFFLLDSQPELRGVFMEIMQACVEPKTKQEVEETFVDLFKSTGFYPGYFISELEDAGGLLWKGKWKTTDIGKRILTSSMLNDKKGDKL